MTFKFGNLHPGWAIAGMGHAAASVYTDAEDGDNCLSHRTLPLTFVFLQGEPPTTALQPGGLFAGVPQFV